MLSRWYDLDRRFFALDAFRHHLEHSANSYESHVGTPINIYDEGAAFVLKAEVPGLKEEDVSITVDQNVVTLKGERKLDVPERYSVHRQERAAYAFDRSFTLPSKVDADQVTAELNEGILKIFLPKVPESQPRKIAITH